MITFRQVSVRDALLAPDRVLKKFRLMPRFRADKSRIIPERPQSQFAVPKSKSQNLIKMRRIQDTRSGFPTQRLSESPTRRVHSALQ